MADSSNRTPGSRSFAALIMSGALSTPTMDAAGKRRAISSVELPGPQPRSAARATSPAGTACNRSRAGRVRSSSNFKYCRADQAISASPYLECAPLTTVIVVSIERERPTVIPAHTGIHLTACSADPNMDSRLRACEKIVVRAKFEAAAPSPRRRGPIQGLVLPAEIDSPLRGNV